MRDDLFFSKEALFYQQTVFQRSQRGIAQSGSASALGAESRGFESPYPDHFLDSPPTGPPVGFFVLGVNLSSTRVLPESGESPLFSYDGVFQTFSR